MAQFQLSPCTAPDLDGMVAVYLHAFTSTHINQALFPPATCTTAAQAAWLHARFARLLSGAKPEMRLFKITHRETGAVVAWSRWGRPLASLTPTERARWQAERQAERQTESRKGQVPSDKNEKDAEALHVGRREGVDGPADAAARKWPVGANVGVCEGYFGLLDQMREKYIRWEEDYVLYFLATDPAYQGRGLGSMLLKQGIELAEAEGRRIYLEATEMGHPLYEKLGWADIDLASFDFTQWGEERPGVHYIMRREPRAREERT